MNRVFYIALAFFSGALVEMRASLPHLEFDSVSDMKAFVGGPSDDERKIILKGYHGAGDFGEIRLGRYDFDGTQVEDGIFVFAPNSGVGRCVIDPPHRDYFEIRKAGIFATEVSDSTHASANTASFETLLSLVSSQGIKQILIPHAGTKVFYFQASPSSPLTLETSLTLTIHGRVIARGPGTFMKVAKSDGTSLENVLLEGNGRLEADPSLPADYAFDIVNNQNFKIQHLRIQGFAGVGIQVENSDSGTFQDLKIAGRDDNGNFSDGLHLLNSDNMTIDGCFFHTTEVASLVSVENDSYAENFLFKNCFFLGTESDDPAETGTTLSPSELRISWNEGTTIPVLSGISVQNCLFEGSAKLPRFGVVGSSNYVVWDDVTTSYVTGVQIRNMLSALSH